MSETTSDFEKTAEMPVYKPEAQDAQPRMFKPGDRVNVQINRQMDYNGQWQVKDYSPAGQVFVERVNKLPGKQPNNLTVEESDLAAWQKIKKLT
jgi:hypothetical protein